MLQRVVRLVSDAVAPVVVVAAVGQSLPDLPPEIALVRDRQAGRGPLEGIAVGLQALEGRADAAFITACDLPWLLPSFIGRLVELSAGYDITVPQIGDFVEVLTAIYSMAVLPKAETLLAAGRLRPIYLFENLRVRYVLCEELADVDPRLTSLVNINALADYRAAVSPFGHSPVDDRP
jgi:molybdenum cofactor guanylyltransferase